MGFRANDADKAALKLFLLYVEGRLTVPDEPHRLIPAAVARGIEEVKRSERTAQARLSPN